MAATLVCGQTVKILKLFKARGCCVEVLSFTSERLSKSICCDLLSGSVSKQSKGTECLPRVGWKEQFSGDQDLRVMAGMFPFTVFRQSHL